jgi:antitoxin ParD1/3/4
MADTERFEVELPAELAAYIHAKVDRDALASGSEVVREALRVMQQRDAKLDALRARVGAAINAGGSLTDEQVEASLEQRARDWGTSRQ